MGATYVIGGPEDDLDGEALYWSNEDGWVDFDSATRFTVSDMLELGLPLEATGWIKLEEA